MKNSHVCPKCGGTKIVKSQMRIAAPSAEVTSDLLGIYAPMIVHTCVSCGYSEIWAKMDDYERERLEKRLDKRETFEQEQAELNAYWKQKLAEQKAETKRKEYAKGLKKDPWEE